MGKIKPNPAKYPCTAPPPAGTLFQCQQPFGSNMLKMATAACGAGRLSCCFPQCPQCQEKPIIRNAISYIYLSLSPPASSSSRLPTKPYGTPLTPWAHFPVADTRDHLPKPHSPVLSSQALAIRPLQGHDNRQAAPLLTSMSGCTRMCLKYAPQQVLVCVSLPER